MRGGQRREDGNMEGEGDRCLLEKYIWDCSKLVFAFFRFFLSLFDLLFVSFFSFFAAFLGCGCRLGSTPGFGIFQIARYELREGIHRSFVLGVVNGLQIKQLREKKLRE